MSEQLRHRLINHEETPPAASWESIAARLDDDRQYALINSRLQNFETTPPPDAWEFIAARLNDDSQYAVVAAKMKTFETAPPPQLWNNIAASLENSSNIAAAPVVSMRRLVYRALAAAVIIAILAGMWWFSHTTTTAVELVKNNPTPSVAPPAPAKDKEPVVQDIIPVVPQVAAATPHHTSQNIEQVHTVPAADNDDHILKYAMVSGIPAFHEAPITISSSPIVDKNGTVIHDLDVLTTNSNYIMVTGPNGQLTRISAKFASVIRYLNGSTDDPEEYLDKVIRESDTWKKRFQEWRNKISQSSFIPSSANFLDIIEFKDLIQE